MHPGEGEDVVAFSIRSFKERGCVSLSLLACVEKVLTFGGLTRWDESGSTCFRSRIASKWVEVVYGNVECDLFCGVALLVLCSSRSKSCNQFQRFQFKILEDSLEELILLRS